MRIQRSLGVSLDGKKSEPKNNHKKILKVLQTGAGGAWEEDK